MPIRGISELVILASLGLLLSGFTSAHGAEGADAAVFRRAIEQMVKVHEPDIRKGDLEKVASCLERTFEDLADEDRKIVLHYQIDPPVGEVERLERLYPGLLRRVESCI